MEKRFLLAFILSFLVLYVWSAIFPPPKPSGKPRISTQTTEKINIPEKSAKTIVVEDSPTFSEKTSYLENSKIRIKFTNRGGGIKEIFLKEFNTALPITNILSGLGSDDEFDIEYQDKEKLVYRSKEAAADRIRKEFRISYDDYIVQSNVQFGTNKKLNESRLFDLDVSSLDKKSHAFNIEKGLFEYFIYSGDEFLRKANAHTFNSKEEKSVQSVLKYAGFRDKYFVFIIKPMSESFENTNLVVKDNNILKVSAVSSSAENNYVIYIGPEERHILDNYGHEFEKVKKYYKLGLFDITAKIIESLMFFIHRFVPNWGVVIILLGAIIYLSMYPLTLRSMDSMKKMQQLQPKIQALKEKHANNPQKMNKEMMELYQKEKINPFGGCLPVLLQMPVFIGLYQVLWRSVSLKNASFLWIKDLSAPDRLVVLKQNFPIIGNEINILPILMIAIMYFQQKMSSRNMIATTPEQEAQQKMMIIIMPFFLGFIFYKFASGLTIYFTVFYLFSAFTQWKMSKKGIVQSESSQ